MSADYLTGELSYCLKSADYRKIISQKFKSWCFTRSYSVISLSGCWYVSMCLREKDQMGVMTSLNRPQTWAIHACTEWTLMCCTFIHKLKRGDIFLIRFYLSRGFDNSREMSESENWLKKNKKTFNCSPFRNRLCDEMRTSDLWSKMESHSLPSFWPNPVVIEARHPLIQLLNLPCLQIFYSCRGSSI